MASNVKVGVLAPTPPAVTVAHNPLYVTVHTEPDATWNGLLLEGSFRLEDKSTYLLFTQV